MGKTKNVSDFEQGMVVGAGRTGLCQERQSCCFKITLSTVSCVHQEWSTTQRISSHFDTTLGSFGVNMGQHPCGMLSTPCRVHALTNCRCSGVQLNIRKVFLMFSILKCIQGCLLAV